MGKIEDKGLRSRIVVEEYTDGPIGPSLELLGTLKDGGSIWIGTPCGRGPSSSPAWRRWSDWTSSGSAAWSGASTASPRHGRERPRGRARCFAGD